MERHFSPFLRRLDCHHFGALRNLASGRNRNAGTRPVMRRGQRMLHLHSLDDGKTLTFHHAVPFCDQKRQHFAVHRRLDRGHPRPRRQAHRRRCRRAAPRSAGRCAAHRTPSGTSNRTPSRAAAAPSTATLARSEPNAASACIGSPSTRTGTENARSPESWKPSTASQGEAGASAARSMLRAIRSRSCSISRAAPDAAAARSTPRGRGRARLHCAR